MTQTMGIVIADDHPLVRGALAQAVAGAAPGCSSSDSFHFGSGRGLADIQGPCAAACTVGSVPMISAMSISPLRG